MTEVAIHNLTLRYPGAGMATVQDLSLTIPSGSLTALLGPSGCGKTTTMKIIAGLLAPDAGAITFDGQPILHTPPERRGAVMVFQNHLLFPQMTVAENIGFGLRMRHLPKADIAARVADMLALVHLPDMGPRRPADLSGGQQQRVALARALIVEPRVLLLDEPLSNLDAHLRTEMRDLIRGLQQRLRITTLFVTHDQEEAVAMADHIALMLEGRLRQLDVPEAFYQRPADPTVARFFGGVNFVEGTASSQAFTSALPPLALPPGMPTGPCTLTIRPEAIRLGPGVNTLQANVTDRQFRGTQTRLHLRVGDVSLFADVPPDQATDITPGTDLTIHLPRAALWIMQSSDAAPHVPPAVLHPATPPR
jgi:ABC-type Fe3+/spermidine/putrescine transport system ATPase subunit